MRQFNPETIFISHSAPSDNYFVTWLSAKLKLLGYHVWVELDELKSGDAFWPSIEDAIRNKTRKFIVVVSTGYMSKVTDPNSGVFKELSCADRIKDQPNFKTPVRIADIHVDDFPVQLAGLNSIDFYQNWQSGLEKLFDSFTKEGIPKNDKWIDNPLNFWQEAFHIDTAIISSAETIYTNWFPLQIPPNLYVHHPGTPSKLGLLDMIYPYDNYSDRHLSFFPKEDYPYTIDCRHTAELAITTIIEQQAISIDDQLTLIQPRRKIVQLLNKIIEDFFKSRGMVHYRQANTSVFYFPHRITNGKRVSLKKVGKTNVAISGKFKDVNWHFGISSRVKLYPEPHVAIASHIVFEKNGAAIQDEDEQHALRRKYGSDWYNKDWLDTLFGMMFNLAGEDPDGQIRIPVSSNGYLILSALPITLTTEFGYNEPEKNLEYGL